MSKIKEGERYDFIVEKNVDLGNNEYYLLRGPENKKFLLPEKHYRNYNIKIGETINCRIDKINCRGEVFLEPANPYYTEGEVYKFKIEGRDIRLNDSGEPVSVFLVKDKFNNELVVPVSQVNDYKVQEDGSVRLKIIRINKGRIEFSIPENKRKGERTEEHEVHDFIIRDIMTGLDGKDYYLVNDKYDRQHVLPVDQYSYYGLKKGKKFKGQFIKYHDSGEYRIEPRNPFYNVGEIYEFKVVSVNDRPEREGKLLVVTDENRMFHEVFIPSSIRVLASMKFRVEKIRKGWPLLIPV